MKRTEDTALARLSRQYVTNILTGDVSTCVRLGDVAICVRLVELNLTHLFGN
jgi:hypothetical protein